MQTERIVFAENSGKFYRVYFYNGDRITGKIKRIKPEAWAGWILLENYYGDLTVHKNEIKEIQEVD